MNDGGSPKLTVSARLRTDVGCVRSVNEDGVGFFNPGGSDGVGSRGSIAVVADGMGGHASGELASSIAIEAVGRVFFEQDGDPRTALLSAFAEANRRIYEASRETPEREGMGTTCTALAIRDGSAWAAHVGDSRLYLLRAGDLFRMTEDDSVVGDLLKRGLLTREEARSHSEKNVILKALGTRPEVATSVWEQAFPVRRGDRFLLTTDGLHDLVPDDELRQMLLSEAPDAAAERLIGLARDRGGPDNITLAIVSIEDAAESRTPRATREARVEP